MSERAFTTFHQLSDVLFLLHKTAASKGVLLGLSLVLG